MKDTKIIPKLFDLYFQGVYDMRLERREHSALEILLQDTVRTLERRGFDMTEYRAKYQKYLIERD